MSYYFVLMPSKKIKKDVSIYEILKNEKNNLLVEMICTIIILTIILPSNADAT